jgi:DNA-binding beta-propeller fold protein YncE
MVACLLMLQGCAGPPNPVAASTAAAVPGYRVLRDVPLPGDTSRWDYQVYDPLTHRLFVAHLGASDVVVFDTRHQKLVATLRDVASVHGLGLAPDLHRLYASATGRNELAIIDTDSLRRVATVPAGDFPDGVAYVPGANRVFISDVGGSGDTIVDAATGHPLGSVDLGGDIGNSYYDPATDRVYVAGGSTNVLAAIDPHTLRVFSRFPVQGCSGAHGVQVVAADRRRAFVSCESSATLVAVDLESGLSSPSATLGHGPDVLSLDPGPNRLYVAAESGVLTVFDVGGPSFRTVARGYAGPNAHAVAVDPESHVVYLPLTNVDGRPVMRELIQR